MGAIKDKMMNEFKTSNISVGDIVMIKNKHIYSESYMQDDKVSQYIVTDSSDNTVTVTVHSGKSVVVDKSNIVRDTVHVGVNPFPEKMWHDDMNQMMCTLSFIHQNKGVTWTFDNGVEIHGFNFNPYITDNSGNKVYFQRDFCWSLEDKQNFIESIYNDLNCGVIVLRVNNDNRVMETHADWDVIDGKQRLSTLIEFFNDEFPDKNGYYWSDFSVFAQRKFKNCKPFTIYEFRENVKDDTVKKAFLNVNFTGVPMSKEHIEFVKSINL